MQLALSEDQIRILDFIDALTRPYASAPLHDAGFALTCDALDAELEQGGFLDVMAMEELGAATAALVAERVARLPAALEAAVSLLVRPLIAADLPRPVCLVEEDQLRKPVRFLKAGCSVVVIGASGVRSFTAGPEHIREAAGEVLYAYPMAYLAGLGQAMRSHPVAADEVRRAWRVALAAEASGLLAAALASVVDHVSQRSQFGRPLATFQALRHRLAEAQVMTNGCHWLAIRAAASGDPGDAALAALHALDTARIVVYDYHQFLGAMGMTLEHPLHLWTYRLKALAGELGGRGANALAAADAIWGQGGV